MDITQTRTIRWDAPTTRTDGQPIVGTVSYIVVIGDNRYTTAETELRINFAEAGYAPGTYTIQVFTQEDVEGVGRISAPATVPLTLDAIANPNPPTNVEVV